MKISFEYNEFKQDSLSVWIFQKLDTFFENGGAEYDIEFDFSGKTFSHEINFTELFSIESNGYKWAYSTSKHFSSIADVLIGVKVDNDKTDEKPIYRLSFIFDKSTFYNYSNFKNLRCHKLSFDDTVFEKGVHFGHIDADEIIFKPRKLGADATFYHRERADIKNGILRGDYIGRIGAFKFRHPLEGSGRTFFVGVMFDEKAEFTDAILDNVVFSYIEKESMSRCFFANSFLENAEFYNCDFPYQIDRFGYLSKDRYGKSYIGSLLFSIIMSVFYCWIIMYKQWGFLPILLLTLPMLYLFIMYSLWYLPNKLFKTNTSTHKAIGDDIAMIKIQKQEHQEDNYRTIREVYRQLKINFEKHGDYQSAGDFYYSQRYCEMINFGGIFNKQFLQTLILGVHYFINGFGERWLRAFVWFLLTIFGFAFLYTPNEDFISTKSTPEHFFYAYKDDDGTCRIDFNESNATNDIKQKAHFIIIAKSNFEDKNTTYKIYNKEISTAADKNKTVFAFDNRFDYHSNEQYIPMLKDEFVTKLIYSFSKTIAPFVSDERKWFQDRSGNAHILAFTESILLWIFFAAFAVAVNNRIRR